MKQNIVEILDSEAERIKKNHRLKNLEDLKNIARAEYNVKRIVLTPLVCKESKVVEYENNFYIFYHASFKPRLAHALGHELGHIVAGHVHGYKYRAVLSSDEEEKEADYFSIQLNEVSQNKFTVYLYIDAILSFKDSFLNFFRRQGEIEHLKNIGLPQGVLNYIINE